MIDSLGCRTAVDSQPYLATESVVGIENSEDTWQSWPSWLWVIPLDQLYSTTWDAQLWRLVVKFPGLCAHACNRMRMFICLPMYWYTCAYNHMCIHICLCNYSCVCVSVYAMHIFMYINSLCIRIYISETYIVYTYVSIYMFT